MSDDYNDFYEDDYLWDLENGFIDESSSGSIGDFHILRTFIGGLILLSAILSILKIDVNDMSDYLYLILLVAACWVWAKIRKVFKG